jgi:hypothetical protein
LREYIELLVSLFKLIKSNRESIDSLTV